MITQREIYLDCNATHPLLPRVREGLAEALLKCEGALANPSSVHRRGQQAKKSVARLRSALCSLLGRGDGEEFILLSGATEAINLAMRGFVEERRALGRTLHLIGSTVEHAAIRDTLACLGEREGVKGTLIPVNSFGQLDYQLLLSNVGESLKDPNVDVLLGLQLANNETGVAFDMDYLLPELSKRFAPPAQVGHGHKKIDQPQRLWILLDAAQALGKMDDEYMRRAMHFADYAAFSAHKFGGPAGIGTLWLRPGVPFRAQMTGGVQERRRRAGTLNALGCLGFALAAEDWLENGEIYRARLRSLRARLVKGIQEIPGVLLHGVGPDGKLPGLCNTINFRVDGCVEESLLLALDLDGFCCSSGSACNSGSLRPSAVLTAMGCSKEQALSAVRSCVGVESNEEEVDAFIASTKAKVAQIRAARAQAAQLFGVGTGGGAQGAAS